MYNEVLEGFIKAHVELFAHKKAEIEQGLREANTVIVKACVNEMLFHAEDDEWLDSHKVILKMVKNNLGDYRYIMDVIDEMVTDGKVDVHIVKTPNAKKVYIRHRRYISDEEGRDKRTMKHNSVDVMLQRSKA